MPDTAQPAENPKPSDRRLHPRKQLWFSYIRLGHDTFGFIRDISESGLSMQVVRRLPDDPLPKMRFQLPPSDAWVETRGRIAWVNVSKLTVGVQFVGLPYAGHIRIRRLVYGRAQSSILIKQSGLVQDLPVKSQSETLNLKRTVSVSAVATPGVTECQNHVAVVKESAAIRSAEVGSKPSSTRSATAVVVGKPGPRTVPPTVLTYATKYDRQVRSSELTISSSKSNRPIWAMVVAALLLSTFIAFVAFRFRPTANSYQTRESVADKTPALPANISADPKIAPVEPSLPLDISGFVLQVGAMTHKDNAEALAESLRKRHFPAFVSRPGTNHFYLVMVGPFHDAATMSKVNEELTRLHIDAIRVTWSAIAQ